MPCFGAVLGVVLGILGTIFSGVGLAQAAKVRRGKGMALAGLILSILAIIWTPIYYFFLMGWIIPGVIPIPPPPPPIRQIGPAPEQRNMGTLRIQFARETTKFDGMEVFIDGKLVQQAIDGWQKQLVLQNPVGNHTVTIKINSTEVFTRNVRLKPTDEGITSLDVPLLDRPDDPGTLKLEIASLDGNWPWARGLELFLDGKLIKTTTYGFEWDGFALKLPPGPHQILFKKNEIEVWSGAAQVKKKADGVSFLKVPLTVLGTVVLNLPSPVRPWIEAHVQVDGMDVKQWPVNTTQVEVPAEVGKRVITVRIAKPVPDARGPIDVEIKPGKKVAIEVPD